MDAVVMPVFDEAATVETVIEAVRAHFGGALVVVDDGSTDDTAEILARRSDVVVVRHERNEGYGRSLIDGFASARRLGASRIVTMDCDGQHEPAHIPAFLAALVHADIVSGSRYLPESPSIGVPPPDRRELNETMTALINASTGWHLTDAFCGFKAYRAQALARLELREPGYAMPVELWAKAWRAGLRVIELPVERIYFDHDRSFGRDLDDPAKRLAYYREAWERALLEEE